MISTLLGTTSSIIVYKLNDLFNIDFVFNIQHMVEAKEKIGISKVDGWTKGTYVNCITNYV